VFSAPVFAQAKRGYYPKSKPPLSNREAGHSFWHAIAPFLAPSCAGAAPGAASAHLRGSRAQARRGDPRRARVCAG